MSAARAAGHLRTAHRPRTAASTFLRSMSSSPSCASPKGPFRLVTVNSQPERAKNVVTQVIARLQDRFAIVYAGNIASEDAVAVTVTELKPDVLFCASSWPAEASARILATAQATQPGLRTYAVPEGLHNNGGAAAVVSHLTEHVGKLLA